MSRLGAWFQDAAQLRVKLPLIIAGCILVIVGIFGYFGVKATNDSTEQTLDERLLLTEQIAFNVDNALGQVFRQLSPALPGEVQTTGTNIFTEPDQYLAELRQRLPVTVHYVAILDEWGEVITTDPDMPQLVGCDLSTLPYIAPVLGGDSPTVSNVLYDGCLDDSVAYISAPVAFTDRPRRTVVAALDIGLGDLLYMIDITKIGQTTRIEIIDGAGIVLAASDESQILKESDHGSVFARKIQAKESDRGECHNCHETTLEVQLEDDIITIAPLAQASWGVVIRQARSEALAHTLQLQQILLFFGLISLAIVVLAVWFITRNITTPLHRLTAAADEIARGDLDEPLEMSGRDEISVLARSFEAMRLRLKDSIQRIQHRTEELEGLNSISLALSQSLNLETILDGALQRIMELTGVELGGIFQPDEKTPTLHCNIYRGLSAALRQRLGALQHEDWLPGQVFLSGELAIIDDVTQPLDPIHEYVVDEGVRAMIGVPLRSRNNVVGVLLLASRLPYKFGLRNRQFLESIAAQLSFALENAKLYEEVRQKEIVYAELLQDSISVQEDERKRIARELHDETSQELTTLAVGLETIGNSPPQKVDELRLALKKNQELAISILDGVHRLMLDLRPSVLDDMGLIAALNWFAENRLATLGIRFHIETSGRERRLPPHIEVTLFRMAQEAIFNIAQHSRAESSIISLEFEKKSVKLEIEDDGSGFDAHRVGELFVKPDGKRGLGLLGIKERAELLGGSFAVTSEPGSGTRVTITVPITGTGTVEG
jgi:signal transduction histidine kinase